LNTLKHSISRSSKRFFKYPYFKYRNGEIVRFHTIPKILMRLRWCNKKHRHGVFSIRVSER